MNNAMTWFEIPVLDFARAKKFYEQLFNYSMSVIIDEKKFKMGLLPTEGGGAIVWNTDFYQPSSTAGMLIYLDANPDLAILLERIVHAGGKTLIEKRLVSPQFGCMAVFIDSEGNRMALHSKS